MLTIYYREQVLAQSDRLKSLDSTTQRVLKAIIQQGDVFRAVHDAQVALMWTIHGETVSRMQYEHAVTRREMVGETVSNIQHEHAITRREIIQEIRVRLLFRSIHHTT